MNQWLFIIAASFALFLPDLHGHAPYEREAGQFTRKDGARISAVLHYVDGILGPDPVAVQFQLRDGTVIAKTERTTDEVIVRSSVGGFTIYTFESDWIPVASAVHTFDGFVLAYSTELSGKSWSSALIHTQEHVRGYLGMVIFVGILVICWHVVVKLPKHGAIEWVRIGLMLLIEFAGFVALVLLSALEISPLILLLFGGVCVAAYLAISGMLPAKNWRRETNRASGLK